MFKTKSNLVWNRLAIACTLALACCFSSGELLRAAGSEGLLDQVQRRTVTGVVKDASGNPVIGAGVVEKGTTNGTVTNLDGQFSIQAYTGAVLEVSCIGYKTVSVTAGNASLTIIMEEDYEALDETVVIGYGTQKKRDLTGAVASVSEEAFSSLAITNITQALSGRVAGLDISSGGIDPGSTGTMLMRGHRSFRASNDPLVILDGIIFGGSLNDINPYDIKSIDVLKDASSTAIYGSRGANGVIIITTKRGETGRPTVKYEGQVGLQVPLHQPWMTAEQFMNRMREGGRATGLTGEALESYVQKRIGEVEWNYYKKGGDTDWQKLLLQNGFRHKHQLTLTGGSERVKYNLTGNFSSDEGIVPTRKFDRLTLAPSIDVNVTDNLTVGLTTLLSYSNRHSRVSSMAYYDARATPATCPPYDEEGNLRVQASNTASWYKNPLTEVETEAYRAANQTYSAYVNGYLNWQIVPSLTYRLNIGADVSNNSNKEASISLTPARHGDGDISSIYQTTNIRRNIENILTWDKTFDIHHVTLTAVQSWQDSHMERNNIAVNQVPYFPALWNNIGAAAGISSYGSDLEEWKLSSFAARAFYSLKDRYLLTATVRADGASQFAPGHKWGFFPSVAFGWRISEEPWMAGTKTWLSNLKLRLSYGVSGNQAISPYQTQGQLSSTKYSFDESEGLGMRPGDLANHNLRWEKTAVYNIGLDFGFLKGRISGNVEVYQSNTTDLLLPRMLPITTGFSSTLENVGATRNRGIELTLNTVNIAKPDFTWNTDLTFYLNREQIVELYNGPVDDIGNKWFIGHPINVFYTYKWLGIWQSDEAAEAAKFARKPGQIKTADLDNSGTVNDADRTIIGTTQPDFVANMVNRFRWKGWDLSFELAMRWGQLVNCSQFGQESATNGNGLAFNYWTPENGSNEYPQPDENARGYQQADVLSIHDGSFIRMRNLSVGYTFPAKILRGTPVSALRIYATGQNLLTWSRAGLSQRYRIDPETGSADPMVNVYTLGVNISF